MILRILATLALAALVPLAASTAASPASVRVQVVDPAGVPVRDAVVELDRSGGYRGGAIRFPWHMAMAQKGQEFVPGTLIVARGSSVAFPNLDRVRHSVYSFSKAARFSIDLYGRDQSRTQKFAIAGSVALGCNIHDWMNGYIRVVETPYAAKTDHNGYARIAAVPYGSYGLTVWHPRARLPGGEFKRSLTIDTGSIAQRVQMRLR
ncbi:cupredoxin domain-containing protein [Alteripontixanthobacter muriae]|uniref:methylamine utilization protein n=1 Tax=Alteripontixanthobacter muriae TaxID=2705546 RepID=UPI001575564E|nr:methylamine utilization protein [Alteripontixanthobacter muriae]